MAKRKSKLKSGALSARTKSRSSTRRSVSARKSPTKRSTKKKKTTVTKTGGRLHAATTIKKPKTESVLNKLDLTPKERRFVEEYANDFNGTLAARRSGYKNGNAGIIACTMLKKPHIQQAIKDIQEEYSKQSAVTRERVMLELARMAFSDMANYIEVSRNGVIHILPLREIPVAARAAIHKVKRGVNGSVHYELYDKKAALELIIKMQGWITDNSNVNINGTLHERVQVYIPDNGRAEIGKDGTVIPVEEGKPGKKIKVKRKHK